jgi:hypothetical protein
LLGRNFGFPDYLETLELFSMEKTVEEEKPAADIEDDFDEPLGERQPEVNGVIVCEGGCE